MTIDDLLDSAAVEAFTTGLIGLAKDAALAAISERGLVSRIVSEDGSNDGMTCDWLANRVGLTVASGKIVGASVG